MDSDSDSDAGKELGRDYSSAWERLSLRWTPVVFDVVSALTKPCSGHQALPVSSLAGRCSENTGDRMAVGPSKPLTAVH